MRTSWFNQNTCTSVVVTAVIFDWVFLYTASCGDILPNTNKNKTFGGSLSANPGIHNKCVWIIVVPVGKIELVFKDRFQVTNPGKGCKENYVQVRDGRYR